ncbi:MAG: hypothetical protein A2V66_18155 [Ignavibacteria bacterium RBG_13_36_8]|nr:MAG: hypothetical protein A2V66_18155 [Ignavibacteria bacterium RBG_13_36_8]
MSFNIRYGTADDGENSWDFRKDIVFEIIKRFHPDILCLQEVLHFQLEEILSALCEYDMVGIGRDDGKTRGEYAAILFLKNRFDTDTTETFWLSDTPEIPGSKSWGNEITRICTFSRFYDLPSKKCFYTFNVHLDHISQISRERSILLVTDKIRNRKYKDPVVLTGDFNAGENNPAVKFLKGESVEGEVITPNFTSAFTFTDTYREIHPDKNKVGTFNSFEGNQEGDKIDYIFSLGSYEIISADIIRDSYNGRFPSDHFPITTILKLKR